MTLPLLLSVPHAGLCVPPEVDALCILTPEQIAADGDVGAAETYLPLEDEVVHLITTDVARAIVDVNRAEDDRRTDGVVKTHTCWHEPVYRQFPSEDLIRHLLERYYRPYHEQLSHPHATELLLAVDCHTMAAVAPPIAPDPGQSRPAICLGNADSSCPDSWIAGLATHFRNYFDGDVTINRPFRGGYITRAHAVERPWVQLEVTRAPALGWAEKRRRILAALTDWVYCVD